MSLVPSASDSQDHLLRHIAALEHQIADLTTRLAARDLATQALESTTCGVTIADAATPELPLISCNTAFERITGYAAHATLGRSCRFLQGPDTDPQAVNLIRTALRDGTSCRVLIRNYRADGTPFWNDLTISPIRDANDQITHFVGIQQDVTVAKATEESLQRLQTEVIAAQEAALIELSTPLIPITHDVMIMPLIGTLDSRRAQHVVDILLEGVAQQRARVAIIDITGIAIVDTQVASALLRAAQAVRMLGAQVMLTGIRPEVAQTLVGLGVNMRGLVTHGTLQQAIANAIRW